MNLFRLLCCLSILSIVSSCKNPDPSEPLENGGFVEISNKKYTLKVLYPTKHLTIFDLRVSSLEREREIKLAGTNYNAIPKIRKNYEDKIAVWRQIQSTGIGLFSVLLLSEGISVNLNQNGDLIGLEGKGDIVYLIFWSKSSNSLENGSYPI